MLSFASAFAASCSHRQALLHNREVTAYRLFDGAGDGVAGIYVDRYGAAIILNVYDDARWSEPQITAGAQTILEALRGSGVEAVYVKRFSKDRSRLGGKAPPESTSVSFRSSASTPTTTCARSRPRMHR